MSRMHRIVVLGAIALLALGAQLHAGPFFYAHPEQVDLAKDLNTTVTGGNSPAGVNTYMPNPQTNFGPPIPNPAIYTVDLGSAQPIGQINFTKYNVAGFGASAWTIQRSLVGGADSNWTDVGSGDDSTASLTADAGGATARYVRIRATAFDTNPNNIWVLQHVAVYGAPGQRIAIRDTLNIGGAPSNDTVATISGPNGSGPNRSDGFRINDMSPNDSTFGLNGGDGLGNPSTLPREITYTFDSAYNIKGIRWSVFNGRGPIKDYQVFASLGGGAETLVDTNTTNVPSFLGYDAFDGAFASGIVADKLRIEVTSYGTTDNAFPSEIEVFASAIPEPASVAMIVMAIGASLMSRRRDR